MAPKVRIAAKIKPGQYDRLLSAFRDKPGNIRHAAREAGVAWETSKRMWIKGAADIDLAPIKPLVENEMVQARVLAEREKREKDKTTAEDHLRTSFEDQEAARQDAVASRKAESDVVRSNRKNVVTLVAVMARALAGCLKRAKALEKRIVDAKDMDLAEEIALLDRMARTVERTTRAAKETMVMERLLLGEPTEIIGLKGVGDFTEDEAIRELELGAQTAVRMRERMVRRKNRLQLLQGGKSSNGATGTNGAAVPSNGAG